MIKQCDRDLKFKKSLSYKRPIFAYLNHYCVNGNTYPGSLALSFLGMFVESKKYPIRIRCNLAALLTYMPMKPSFSVLETLFTAKKYDKSLLNNDYTRLFCQINNNINSTLMNDKNDVNGKNIF